MARTILTAQSRISGLNLVVAAENGDIEAVKAILAGNAYIHTQNGKGISAIVAAAYANNIEIAKLLINAGADVNMKDDTIQSAFLISAMQGYLEFMKLTLDAGADVFATDSDNGTALIRASDRGHVEIIKELLKTNIRVNHVNRMGWIALHEAVICGDGGANHTEIARLLIGAGALVNLADKDGLTPLDHARKRNYTKMVKILEEAAAN